MNAGALVYCILDADAAYTPDGYELLDVATAGDYELRLWRGRAHREGETVKYAEVSLNAVGRSFDPESQAQKYKPTSTHALGRRDDLLRVVASWLQKYGEFYIGSYNPQKVNFYYRLFKRYLARFEITEPYAAFDECEGKPEYFKISARPGVVESLLEKLEPEFALDAATYINGLPSRTDRLAAKAKAKTCTKAEAVEYAITCAEQVIHIFTDKHPNNNKPQQAIDAAKAWLKNPTEKNKNRAFRAYLDACSVTANATTASAIYSAVATASYAAYAAAAADTDATETAEVANAAGKYAALALRQVAESVEADEGDLTRYVDALPSVVDRIRVEALKEFTSVVNGGYISTESLGEQAENCIFDAMASLDVDILNTEGYSDLFQEVLQLLLADIDQKWPVHLRNWSDRL